MLAIPPTQGGSVPLFPMRALVTYPSSEPETFAKVCLCHVPSSVTGHLIVPMPDASNSSSAQVILNPLSQFRISILVADALLTAMVKNAAAVSAASKSLLRDPMVLIPLRLRSYKPSRMARVQRCHVSG